ncbi:Orn/Lys/Arg family decarboxylase [Acidocella aminolytica]|uniref:Response regulator receiver/decarboxylase n=1 Tax=Acidocella aminolytica 101 = DSM 11237 TaxID=1120923 RepID=A0A0D6PIY1_9PROT|nr:Orn/Lys/Arg decarboxylase N-terminal domain-containing protein [Acidocella aminolytica]GAN81622.1 response regulator receiver/decarboxylase [Acidocella aminolytica 101 = DSM 11237]GBQ36551.1 arginine/lysine/ornithine decarboxylase [Acidocella aminolytica 101 = DSM 11237]SHF26191.1 arginine decarboxylase [Acidocella aminolytica 101 = DSM 11237]
MTEQEIETQFTDMSVLVVNDKLAEANAIGRASRRLVEDLRHHGVGTILSNSAEDALAVIGANPHLQAMILDWDLQEDPAHRHAMDLLRSLRAHNENVPVFLLAERSDATRIPMEVMSEADEFIWLLEDTMEFISERIVAAIRRYRTQMLPPMFRALMNFAKEAEYSWHTPGHTGGTAFLRSPAGRVFHDYFGEALFRSDLSISVGELGSLLDHSGPIGEGERYAARVFGADRSYYVTNGTSTSNRVVMMASIARGQIALADRNCHKSVEHGLSLTGAVPVYLMPHRNHLGLIGPIPPSSLTAECIRNRIADTPLAAKVEEKPALAIITNSTYDGLCYNAPRVEELLAPSVDRILFDEAWFGYARFNPIYKDRFAMRGDPAQARRDGPTIFATQSTHKLLAALSQASMIHLREGGAPVEHSRFNEAFMMHASTSPQYAIIASNDVSAAMMEGVGGRLLTGEAIAEAISFRQTMARLTNEFMDRGTWFFGVWQPDRVRDDSTELAFADAPPDMLAQVQSCWMLEPGAEWHGFPNLERDYCMLDPIKVTVTTPGMDLSGGLSKHGIPASLLTAYLAEHGIVAEKTANFSILFLFSIGVTKGKWGSLVNALLEFKRDYDANAPLTRVMPALVQSHPGRYGAVGLRDLGEEMFTAMRDGRIPELLQLAYDVEPRSILTPATAYDQLIRQEGDATGLGGLASSIAATAIVPYPPGIPLVMPGEALGALDSPVLRYLGALQAFDQQFPSFEHDIHGIEVLDGEYRAMRFLAP